MAERGSRERERERRRCESGATAEKESTREKGREHTHTPRPPAPRLAPEPCVDMWKRQPPGWGLPARAAVRGRGGKAGLSLSLARRLENVGAHRKNTERAPAPRGRTSPALLAHTPQEHA